MWVHWRGPPQSSSTLLCITWAWATLGLFRIRGQAASLSVPVHEAKERVGAKNSRLRGSIPCCLQVLAAQVLFISRSAENNLQQSPGDSCIEHAHRLEKTHC